MTKARGSDPSSEMRDEYDLNALGEGVRGKYLDRYREGTNLVLLQPDVAAAFPDAESVNEALRELMKVASRARREPDSEKG